MITDHMTPGWYALGFELDDGRIIYDAVAEYHGVDRWTDEDGAPLVRVWCPALQHYVHPGNADAFERQIR